MQMDQSQFVEQKIDEIKDSLRKSLRRFFNDLTERSVHGALAETGQKAIDLVFKTLV